MEKQEEFAFLLVFDGTIKQWCCTCPAYPSLLAYGTTRAEALKVLEDALPGVAANSPQRGHTLTHPMLMFKLSVQMNHYLRLGLTEEVTPEDISWAMAAAAQQQQEKAT